MKERTPHVVSMHLLLAAATLGSTKTHAGSDPTPTTEADWHAVVEPALQRLGQLVEAFSHQRVTPAEMFRFEQDLHREGQELLRVTMQWACNRLEASEVRVAAQARLVRGELVHAAERENAAECMDALRANPPVACRLSADGQERRRHDLPAGVEPRPGSWRTPALAERAACLLGGSGMTQLQTLERLRQDHGVRWARDKAPASHSCGVASPGRRASRNPGRAIAAVAEASRGVEGQAQADASASVATASRWAYASDAAELFEVASDRHGERARPARPTPGHRVPGLHSRVRPANDEPGTDRVAAGPAWRWDAPLPRLCYVTDAGDNETAYYENVLRRMKRPNSGQPLAWIRVVDYYHASTRIWTLGRTVLRQGAASDDVGSKDVEVAQEAGRREPRPAFGGGAAVIFICPEESRPTFARPTAICANAWRSCVTPTISPSAYPWVVA